MKKIFALFLLAGFALTSCGSNAAKTEEVVEVAADTTKVVTDSTAVVAADSTKVETVVQ